MWNEAWVQCQEARQRLEERLKKESADKKQSQQLTAAASQGKRAVMEQGEERSGAREAGCSAALEMTSPKKMVKAEEESRDSGARRSANNSTCLNPHMKPDLNGSKGAETPQLPDTPAKDEPTVSLLPQNGDLETKWRPREHHSEADLRRVDSIGGGEEFPWHQALGRSLSEGSCVSSLLSSITGSSPLSTRHCQIKSHSPGLSTQPILNSPISRNDSFCSGHSCCRSSGDSHVEEGGPAKGSSDSSQSPNGVRTQEAPLLTDTTDQSGSNVL